jgi:hypothetical protein
MDTQALVRELTDIENEIKSQENKKARLEGEQQTILNRLKSDFDCESVRMAKRLLSDMIQNKEELEKEIQSKMEELRAAIPEQ